MANTDLMAALVVASVKFGLSYGQETSGQAGGTIRVADLRSPLWTMEAECSTLTLDQLLNVETLIDQIGGSKGSFYAWDPRRPFPELDPDGSGLGASAVKINSLGADNRSLSLKGLPPGYVVSRGDPLCFDFGGRRAFHRISSVSAAANGGGVTPEFEVVPNLRTGAATNADVTLKRPTAEMRLVPGSFNGNAQGMLGSINLQAVQVV
ncbi:hypothetical protein [Kaistia sp. MMO-174]|uniref:hypothetical protein n=1 Tax=Kaistia sp. MMO-174 TaxID=3081256 RepID=UPI003017DE07